MATADQALQQIRQLITTNSAAGLPTTLDSVRAVVNSTSASLSENVNTYVFYSGDYLNASSVAQLPSSRQAALSLAAQSDRVGIIDNTEVGKLLNNSDFRTELLRILPPDAVDRALFGGDNPISVRESFWGQASDRFATLAGSDLPSGQ